MPTFESRATGGAPVERAPAASEGGSERDRRAIVADGVCFSVMVGLGETYVPAFALAVGLGEVVAGLVATLPMLAGALLQLVTPWAVHRLRSYRRWVVLCARLQALSFVPLVVGAAAGDLPLAWLALATVAYWAFGMATGPAWNAWVTSLVPEEMRTRFFAARSRASHAALLAGIVAGGLALEWGRGRDAGLALFAVLFAASLLARLASARFLASQSEAPGLAEGHRAMTGRAMLASLRAARSGRVFAYLLGMQVAVNVASPFFTPYMLGPLGLSYVEFMVLTGAALAARVAVLPLVGRIAHGRGTRFVLWWGAVGIVPLPVLWLVSSDFAYLCGVQLVAGSVWGALELATLLSFFEGIEADERASILSAFNLATAVAIALGALLGSRFFLALDAGPGVYGWLFAVSTLGRLVMLPALRGTMPARHLVDVQLRSLAVRPSVGAVERPILASVEDDEEPDGPPPAAPAID